MSSYGYDNTTSPSPPDTNTTTPAGYDNTTSPSPPDTNTTTPAGYDNTTSPSPPDTNTTTPASSSNSSNTKLGAGIGAGIGIPVLLIVVAIFIFWFKKKKSNALAASSAALPQSQKQQQNASPPARDTSPMLPRRVSDGSSFGSKTIFTYEELEKATNGFSEANFLGKGGFGDVYRGVLIPEGKEVAIKKLKPGSDQGDREFEAEIKIISSIHHKHLVSLAGYCIHGTERLLVYQFVPNKTLKFHLHGVPKIIHRDIKSRNILLDYNFEAKVADFGLARFNTDNQTHLSTAAAGTRGYIAPECINGKINEKSDVYSFGVVLLELITSKPTCEVRPTGEAQYIVDWAEPLLTKALKDKNFDILADPRLQRDYNPVEMARMVTCAATCVRHSAQRRPQMSQIVLALEGNVSLDDLSEGIRPRHSTIYESPDNVKAEEDYKIFRNVAPGSQEYGANGDSVTNPSAPDYFQ